MTSPNPMALEAKALEAAAEAYEMSRSHIGSDDFHIHSHVRAAIRAYLAALPPPAAGEGLEPVAVKPKRLQWVSMMGGEKWQAFSVVGLYVVYRGQWWRGEPDIWVDGTEHRDNESAKAAVQDDFDERIRSALAATPAARAAVLEPSGQPKWSDLGYLLSIIDSAIEDGFDPDEDGQLLDEIRAALKEKT